MKKLVRKSVTEGKPLKYARSESAQNAREIEIKLAMIESQLTQTSTQPDGRKTG